MLSLFKTVHIYIENDSLYWIFLVNGKVEKYGVYNQTIHFDDLKLFFLKELNVKSLHFINFKINVSKALYKIVVLPYLESYFLPVELEVISQSLFDKKYLNFDSYNYQIFSSKQFFGRELVFIALDKMIYNCFSNLGGLSLDFCFEALELLKFLKEKKSCILSFGSAYYYYDFNGKALKDISLIDARVVEKVASEIIYIENNLKVDVKFWDDSIIFPRFVSLLCTQ